MSDTVIISISKERLRRVLVAAWTDCLPAAHLDLDEAWRLLSLDVPLSEPERSWENWYEESENV